MTSPTTSAVRLYLMQVAAIPGRDLPIVCYLIQTTSGTNVLIDSGLAPNTAPPPGLPSPIMGKNVVEQLAELDLQPHDIHLFVCTHFDSDHAGNNDLFTKAEFIVQRKHYESALDNPRFTASRPHWDQPALRYRFIDGDTELLPGIKLIETSGHTPGHQSVLVRLPESGPILLTIDAVSSQSRFTPDREAGPADDDPAALRASTQKLLDIAEREKVSLVVFGHDGAQWQTLRKLPDAYC